MKGYLYIHACVVLKAGTLSYKPRAARWPDRDVLPSELTVKNNHQKWEEAAQVHPHKKMSRKKVNAVLGCRTGRHYENTSLHNGTVLYVDYFIIFDYHGRFFTMTSLYPLTAVYRYKLRWKGVLIY